MWLDEHLTFIKNSKELAKSASRALGAPFNKFASSGGMSHSVYTKLYNSMVDPILMYGSAVWGTKSINVINTVQNKACKFFLSVGKNTSNLASRGDMGWISCLNKQRISCIRLLCKITRTDENRNVFKIWKWASRRRKGWCRDVDKFTELLNIRNTVNDLSLSTKTVMKFVTDKIKVLDITEWQSELFNDRGHQNGNKLRTYRLFKTNNFAETYVLQIIPRSYRRTLALFRAGSLPLAIETGRYTRPPTALENRLCKFCSLNSVESEKLFF